MSRTRRSAANFAASAGLSALTLIGGLIASPLLAGWLGDEAFGAWRALSEAAMWLTLLEFGLLGAMQPVFARALAGGKVGELHAAVRAAGRGYGRATLLKFVVLAAAIPVVGWLIPVGADDLPDLRLATLTLLAGVPVAALGYARVVIECRQQSYLVTALLTAQYLVTLAAALLLARDGWGVTGQAAAATLGAVALNGGIALIELRRGTPLLAGLRPRFRRRPRDGRAPGPEGAESEATGAEELEDQFAAELRKFNGPVFLRQLGGRAAVWSDSLIVAFLLDPAAVTGFYFTRRACDLVGTQVGMISSATWAGLGELYHGGDRAAYRERVAEVTKLAALVAAAGLLPAVLLNQSFVTLWAGEERYAGPLVTAASAAVAFLLPITFIWDWALHAAGHVRALVPMSLAAAALNIAFSFGLTPHLGVAGPLLGTAISYAATAAWYEPLLMRRKLGFRARDLYAAALRPLAPAVAAGLIAWPALPAGGASTWPELFVYAGAIGGSYVVLAWFAALTAAERRRWGRLLSRRVRPQRGDRR
ncbi:polysaccharide biosynthesis C-terminal domain-containing protein [Alienimonas sp. DA493]|uniref:polysaccharide biosynthesis C-terminal domain-containing protein n=1 Tax=Alienimonas sp. DA493 TaxID=3373605 RepID=UPI0037549981